MKRFILFLSGIIIATAILAQAPQGISHQAVMRDAENNLVVESPIGLQVSILQGAHDGVAVYVETHDLMTNQNGLISYVIGAGAPVAGVFEEIDWSAGPYWLKTEADPTGGGHYTISGVTQFLSIPYSIYAAFAEHAETFTGLDELLDRIEAIEEALDIIHPGPYNLYDVAIEAAALPGYQFSNWTGDTEYMDDPSSANAMVTMPADDVTLTANFEEEEDPEFTCGENINFTYRGEEVTYGTILRDGLCWLDRNLGADPMPFVPADDATGNTDARLYGDLFQWGRLDDGHQDRTSGTTSTLSNTDIPGHGNYITVSSQPMDWRSPQNDNLWQGEAGINNPCPTGWRVPTEAELDAERLGWSSNNAEGAYESTLKWPVAGNR